MLCLRTGRGGQCTCFLHSPCSTNHSEAQVHTGGRSDSHSPLVAESVVVSTPTSSLCGTPPVLSLPSRSSVPAGSEVCLGRKVVPSARMESLMRHYKAAGFSDEVSRLAAAPRRLRFARWAAGQGFDPLDPTAAQIASFLFTLFDSHGLSPQTVKSYRTCLGSVLNRTGKAKVVIHKTISDMMASMELQRPRVRPKKINNMFLRHFFLENDAGGRLFIFDFFE